MQADAAADGKTKRPQDGQQAAKKQCQAQRALPDSLTVQSIPPDGNCLFGAFSAGLALANGKSAVHPTLIRAQVTQHLKKHQSAYEPLWQGELPDTTKSSDFAEYLTAIGREGSWGSSLEIRALARLYNTRIVIFPRQFHFNVAAVHTQQKRRVVVLLHNGSHFDLVKPVQDKGWPQEILDVCAELPPTMRGGGPSSEAGGSLRTVWTAASGHTVWTEGNRSKKSSGKCSRQTVWTEARPSSRRPVRDAPGCAAASAAQAGKRKPSPSRATAWTPSKNAASSVGSRAPGLSAVADREATGEVEQELEAMVQECAAGPRRPGLSKSMLFCAFFLPCLLVCSCLLSYLLWRSLNTLNTHHHDTQNWREPHHRILIINGCCSENFIENSNFLKDSDSDQSLVKPNKYSRYLYPNNWKAQPQNRNLQPETQAWNRKPLWAHSRRLQQPP